MNRKSFIRNIFGTTALTVLKPILPIIPVTPVIKEAIETQTWMSSAEAELWRQWYRDAEMRIWSGHPTTNTR